MHRGGRQAGYADGGSAFSGHWSVDVGLIRKSLAVGTVGFVRPSSKKQRVAKATMKSAAATSAATQAAADAAATANRLADQHASEEREYRYATDPVYRKYIDGQNAAAAEVERIRLERFAATERRRLAERQLRKDRSAQRRNTMVSIATQGAILVVLVVAIFCLAVFVWAPQRLVGLVRRKRYPLWKPTGRLADWYDRRRRP
jgi:hypothetical protein